MNCFVCRQSLEPSEMSPNIFHCSCKKMVVASFPGGFFEYYQSLKDKVYHVKGSSAYRKTTVKQVLIEKEELRQLSSLQLLYSQEKEILSFDYLISIEKVEDVNNLLPRLLKLIIFS